MAPKVSEGSNLPNFHKGISTRARLVNHVIVRIEEKNLCQLGEAHGDLEFVSQVPPMLNVGDQIFPGKYADVCGKCICKATRRAENNIKMSQLPTDVLLLN
jgi:hypothetical protein